MIFNHSRLICAFSKKPYNMSLVYGDTADSLKNRQKFLRELGIDCRDLVCAQQVHKSRVRHVEETDRGKGALFYETALPETDALITDKPNLPLAVFTADCLSVFLYDPKTPAVGLVHAGWRSARGSIVSKALKVMKERFETSPQDLMAGFGPAIGSCCYEVKKEFKEFFPEDIIEKNKRYYLDLAAVNKKQLLRAGVKKANIFDSDICTSCRKEEFFSYRREGSSCGRMMSVIVLKQ